MRAIAEFKRGIQSEFSARLVGSIASALTIVFLARFLGSEQFGLLFLAISVLSIISVVGELGIGKSTGRYISEYKEEEPGQVYHIIKYGILINTMLLVAVTGGVLLTAGHIATFVGEPDLELLLLAGIAYLVAHALFKFVRYTFQGLQQIKTGAVLKIVNRVCRLVFVVVLVFVGYQALGGLIGYVLSFLVAAVVGFGILASTLVSNYTFSEQSQNGIARRIAEYSLPLTLTRGSKKIIKELDIFLIGFFLTPAAVGYYKVSKQVISFTQLPASTMGYSLSPAFSGKKAAGAIEQASELYEETLTYTLLLYLPGAIGLILVAEPVIQLFFGTEYSSAVPVLQILAVFTLFQAITHVTSGGLDYLGRATHRAILKGVSSVGNVILNLLLIPRFGIIGAAIATVVTYGCYTLGNVSIMGLELNIRLGYFARTLAKIALMTTGMAAAVLGVQAVTDGIVALVASIGTGVVVCAVFSLLFGLVDRSEITPNRFQQSQAD